MSFLAIVHAPALRRGARLCIADLAQTLGRPPVAMSDGAEISLRFGTCCPDLASGAIVGCDAGRDEAVLTVDDATWTIRRSRVGGIGVPGLVAEDWFVVGA